jgi:hypothetical protein
MIISYTVIVAKEKSKRFPKAGRRSDKIERVNRTGEKQTEYSHPNHNEIRYKGKIGESSD